MCRQYTHAGFVNKLREYSCVTKTSLNRVVILQAMLQIWHISRRMQLCCRLDTCKKLLSAQLCGLSLHDPTGSGCSYHYAQPFSTSTSLLSRDFYRVLKVSEKATADEIKEAYLLVSREDLCNCTSFPPPGAVPLQAMGQFQTSFKLLQFVQKFLTLKYKLLQPQDQSIYYSNG